MPSKNALVLFFVSGGAGEQFLHIVTRYINRYMHFPSHCLDRVLYYMDAYGICHPCGPSPIGCISNLYCGPDPARFHTYIQTFPMCGQPHVQVSIAAIPRSLSTLSSVQSVAFDGSNRFLAVAGQDTG